MCVRHGGNLPSVRAAAEREYLALLRGDRGWLSPWAKREIIRSYEAGQRRYTRRQAKRFDADPQPSATRAKATHVRPADPPRVGAPDPFNYDGWN